MSDDWIKKIFLFLCRFQEVRKCDRKELQLGLFSKIQCNSLTTSGKFCPLPITFADSLENVEPHLDPNCLMVFLNNLKKKYF